MAKKPAKKANSSEIRPVVTRWTSVVSSSGVSCTECGQRQKRGMMWVDGTVRACRACGQRIARGTVRIA